MSHYKKHAKKPLFDNKQGEIFVSFLDDEQHKKIAQLIFVGVERNLDVAEEMNYSVRQIERIRADITKTVLKKLIEKQIPKKPKILTWQLLIDSGWKHGCPNCGCAVGINKNLGFAYEEYLEPNESYCCSCGQALDWGDSE